MTRRVDFFANLGGGGGCRRCLNCIGVENQGRIVADGLIFEEGIEVGRGIVAETILSATGSGKVELVVHSKSFCGVVSVLLRHCN